MRGFLVNYHELVFMYICVMIILIMKLWGNLFLVGKREAMGTLAEGILI